MYLPCKNPNCNSYGQEHPNCRCYGSYAEGGEASHFCSKLQSHEDGCQYFAQGGEAHPMPEQEDPRHAVDHAAVEHGLLGLLKTVGQPKLHDPDRHVKMLREAKAKHAAPTAEDLPQTLGHTMGGHIAKGDYDKAAELAHGHPMFGEAGKAYLNPVIRRLAGPLVMQEPHPSAMRASSDYLVSGHRGLNKLKKRTEDVIGTGLMAKEEGHEDKRNALKEHLTHLETNPEAIMGIGGDLGHYLPEHQMHLAAMAGQAISYLKSIKPESTQNSPLDIPSQPDKASVARYDRQLDIANNPLLVLQHTREGTLQPQDLQTLQVLYPTLHKSIIDSTMERIVNHKASGKDIPYQQKQSLSLLFGQPLDSTMTPQSMQAIINSVPERNRAQQPGKKSGASEKALKEIDKVTKMSETPLQARQVNKKS